VVAREIREAEPAIETSEVEYEILEPGGSFRRQVKNDNHITNSLDGHCALCAADLNGSAPADSAGSPGPPLSQGGRGEEFSVVGTGLLGCGNTILFQRPGWLRTIRIEGSNDEGRSCLRLWALR